MNQIHVWVLTAGANRGGHVGVGWGVLGVPLGSCKEPAQTRVPFIPQTRTAYRGFSGEERQGPRPPGTHHLHRETDRTGHMIRAVKRQVLGAGEPGEVPHPAAVEGIRGGLQEEVMSTPK